MLYIQKKAKNVNKDQFKKGITVSRKEKKTVEPEVVVEDLVLGDEVEEKKPKQKKNKKEKVEEMDANKLRQAEELVNALSGVDPNCIKRIKSDNGLIERTESSKIVLTEDNRQILND